MESIIYEGYGPRGTAIMIECLSDNCNRTVGEVRHAFTRCGGNLSTDGSVSYFIYQKRVITYAAGIDEALLMEVALEAGAKDIISYNDVIYVYTAWESLWILKDILTQADYNAKTVKILILLLSKVNMNTKTAIKLLHLINILKHCEGVHEGLS